jgi:hypothetical protein
MQHMATILSEQGHFVKEKGCGQNQPHSRDSSR